MVGTGSRQESRPDRLANTVAPHSQPSRRSFSLTAVPSAPDSALRPHDFWSIRLYDFWSSVSRRNRYAVISTESASPEGDAAFNRVRDEAPAVLAGASSIFKLVLHQVQVLPSKLTVPSEATATLSLTSRMSCSDTSAASETVEPPS